MELGIRKEVLVVGDGDFGGPRERCGDDWPVGGIAARDADNCCRELLELATRWGSSTSTMWSGA